ncbi:Aldo/keto reductase [Exidia glandulosa HHB12029]|uniref:Aldo/keto reductase n=1 Tax=Exidia glandulosa HHB12029 TaxID=1314781 RepID=A0A165KXD4_EXIGL|nr:Aldo/keto reductase [Exidia glandulosa HHB12029]
MSSSTKIGTFLLNDGTRIPRTGWGTGTALFKQDVTDVTALAIKSGLTHLDTAQAYCNEDSLASGIATSGVPRSSIYLLTKINELPEGKTIRDTIVESLQKLRIDTIDLFLIHSPLKFRGEGKKSLQAAWRALEEAKAEGLAKSIGVSNFMIEDLEDILETATVVPAVNQIEFHAYLLDATRELLEYNAKKGIVIEAYGGLSPLFRKTGGPLDYPPPFNIQATYAGGSATQGQILIKWLHAKGIVALTTTSKESRMKEIRATETLPDLTADEVKAIDKAGSGQHHRAYWKGILP